MINRWMTLVASLIIVAGAAGIVYWFWPREDSSRLQTSPHIRQVGTMLATELDESSGIVESRSRPGIYWTHNDRGNRSAIFAVARNGDSINRFLVDIPKNDLEDIAFDEEGRLYLGDIGDNGRERSQFFVYRLPEPDPRGPSAKDPLPVERRWQLRCPREPLDFEAMFIWQGNGYLISKNTRQHPPGLYRFPLDAPDKPITLENLGRVPTIRDPVTAADIRQDGKLLAILTYTGLYIYRIDGDLDQVRRLRPTSIPLLGHRIEACCFTTGGVLITSESREVFFCEATAYASLLDDPVATPPSSTRPAARPKR